MVHKKYSARQITAAAGAGVCVVFILFFYLWQITETVRLGYETNKAEAEKRVLQKEVLLLKTEKASHLALDKVERTARERLGLTDPREDQVIYEESK
jgi:cell division protein FtsL